MARVKSETSKQTPLSIIALLLGTCDVVGGALATTQTGNAQAVLVGFVVLFPVLIAVMFFWILYHRNSVFYPPSEYGGDPTPYVTAMNSLKNVAPTKLTDLAEKAEASPSDSGAKFALISELIEPVVKQWLILMKEKQLKLVYETGYDRKSLEYETASEKSFSSGMTTGFDLCRVLAGTGLLEISAKDQCVSLTPTGNEFVKWLIETGQKFPYFTSTLGGWGTLPQLWIDQGKQNKPPPV